MEDLQITKADLLFLFARLALATAAAYFTVKMVASAIDPTSKQKREAKKKASIILEQLGIKEKITLTEHELMIATQLVVPGDLKTTWKDIAGLDSTILELQETLILPIHQQMKHNKSRLIQPPKGILLHGPPGCGKTLLARAVAQEAGSRFINLDVASLTDKWYGESQKLSGAVFSFASKIQPCIIFIDEIDSFLRVRAMGDHEATAMMKAQFLQQWDGLATDYKHCIIVMGATNRPQDVDRAILRRMPASFHVPLPSVTQREQILSLVLKDEDYGRDVDLNELACQTESFSGSDLRELCRTAAVYRLRHLLPNSEMEEPLRPISGADFTQALNKMRESRVHERLANALLKMDLD